MPQRVLTEEEKEDLLSMFTYHPPKGDQPERYKRITKAAYMFATVITECCPKSKQTENAVLKVVEARMMANSAIAIGESRQP